MVHEMRFGSYKNNQNMRNNSNNETIVNQTDLTARFAQRNARFARRIARFARESTIPRTAFRTIASTPRAGVSDGCFGTTVVLPGVIHEARGGATR